MDTPWAIPVVLVAWVGHAFIWTVILNVVYSLAWPRKLLRCIRVVVGLAVIGFPIFAYPHVIHPVFSNRWWNEQYAVGYLYLCITTAVAILPLLTLRRARRPVPKQVIEESSRVIDIAADLGFRPLGFGKHWRLARVPFNQLFQVDFVERTLRLPRLPAAWDGLTILHLSDLHFHGTPERLFFQRLIERINDHGTPDLVCITGDIVDTVWHQHWIKPLLGQLKWHEAGLAILGNHDQWYQPAGIRRQLRRAGFTVLGNGQVELIVRGELMIAIGHEGPWFSGSLPLGGGGLGWGGRTRVPVSANSPPQPSPTGGAGENLFRLLLSHTPDNITWARHQDVDLMLSGHVHGGQVRVPVLGSLFVPSRYSRKYDQGVFFEPPTLLSVNRGLSGREPLRINCRPEVTWITLRAN